MRKVRKRAKKRTNWLSTPFGYVEWGIAKKNFWNRCRTLKGKCWVLGKFRVGKLRLRKSSLKWNKNVNLDSEQEFIDKVGQYFCWGCRTLSKIIRKKNFTKIFTIKFSRIFQSQKLEHHRNMIFFLSQHHPFLVFSSSNESQHRVLQDW